MAVVYHDQRIVFVGKITNGFQVRDIPIHTEHPIGGNHADPGILRVFENALQVRHVVVVEPVTLRLAEPYAVDDAGVVELVADDGIFGAEDGFEKAGVGVEAGSVKDGVLRFQETGHGRLELFVDILGAADKPHRREAEPIPGDTILGGLDQRGMIRKSEIVVRTEIDHVLTGCYVNFSVLLGYDDPFVFEKARFLDLI